MLLTVCIEAGRKTLTHTSWIGLTPASRKWMSGQAAALAATQDRTQFANLSASHPLRGPLFQASGDLRLLLTLLIMDVPEFPPIRAYTSRLEFYKEFFVIDSDSTASLAL